MTTSAPTDHERATRTNGVHYTAPVKAFRPFGLTPPRLPPLEAVPAAAPQMYSPQVAYLASVVSAWAYSDAKTMAGQLAYYGLPECTVREFEIVNDAMLVVAAAYFVRSKDGRVGVLAFRGTKPNDFINWLTDTNTSLTNFQYGKVHTGFYENLQPLWGEIANAVDEARKPRHGASDGGHSPLENLYITGHSLGAAMAVIAAARIFSSDYLDWQPLVRGVYTFGQPSVGDGTFARHFESLFNLYRHVYRYDVVPRLPPADVGDFPHFGTEFYSDGPLGWEAKDPPLTTQCRLVTAAIVVSLASFLARRLTLLRTLKLRYSIEDHGPQGYMDVSRRSL
jgi:hypothetical protein